MRPGFFLRMVCCTAATITKCCLGKPPQPEHQPKPQKSKKDFWQAEVTKMIKSYGAPIEDADVGKIVDYLSATY
jgi:hypothetical protein